MIISFARLHDCFNLFIFNVLKAFGFLRNLLSEDFLFIYRLALGLFSFFRFYVNEKASFNFN